MGEKTGDELVMSIFEKEKRKDKTQSIEYKQCLKAMPKINERFKIYYVRALQMI